MWEPKDEADFKANCARHGALVAAKRAVIDAAMRRWVGKRSWDVSHDEQREQDEDAACAALAKLREGE